MQQHHQRRADDAGDQQVLRAVEQCEHQRDLADGDALRLAADLDVEHPDSVAANIRASSHHGMSARSARRAANGPARTTGSAQCGEPRDATPALAGSAAPCGAAAAQDCRYPRAEHRSVPAPALAARTPPLQWARFTPRLPRERFLSRPVLVASPFVEPARAVGRACSSRPSWPSAPPLPARWRRPRSPPSRPRPRWRPPSRPLPAVRSAQVAPAHVAPAQVAPPHVAPFQSPRARSRPPRRAATSHRRHRAQPPSVGPGRRAVQSEGLGRSQAGGVGRRPEDVALAGEDDAVLLHLHGAGALRVGGQWRGPWRPSPLRPRWRSALERSRDPRPAASRDRSGRVRAQLVQHALDLVGGEPGAGTSPARPLRRRRPPTGRCRCHGRTGCPPAPLSRWSRSTNEPAPAGSTTDCRERPGRAARPRPDRAWRTPAMTSSLASEVPGRRRRRPRARTGRRPGCSASPARRRRCRPRPRRRCPRARPPRRRSERVEAVVLDAVGAEAEVEDPDVQAGVVAVLRRPSRSRR